jgi:hypothetical protein
VGELQSALGGLAAEGLVALPAGAMRCWTTFLVQIVTGPALRV